MDAVAMDTSIGGGRWPTGNAGTKIRDQRPRRTPRCRSRNQRHPNRAGSEMAHPRVYENDNTLRDRLFAKVSPEPNSGCWLWDGAIGTDGYGAIRAHRDSDGVRARVTAHRVSYRLAKGPIPNGLWLDHICRVRSCVNPDHLEPVTPQINILRGESVGAIAVRTNQCKRGHKFTPSNTKTRKDGSRRCLTCAKIYQCHRARS
jgi:hypothetical protein